MTRAIGDGMRIIVIGGAQRSGTTLLQTLIANALPNAPLLPEAHILCDLLHVWQSAKANWSKTSRVYSSEDEVARFFRTVILPHIEDIKARYPATENLVLKNPGFIRVLPEIAELFPSATILVSVRDPRDIVASFVKIGMRESKRGRVNRYSRREISFMCKKINAAYAPFLQEGASTGTFLVRYEDVAERPAAALESLARETGLPLKTDRLNSLVWLDDEARHQETWRTELEGGAPSAESVGNYRNLLNAEERLQVQKACRALIGRFSYPLEEKPAPLPSLRRRMRDFLRRGRNKAAV